VCVLGSGAAGVLVLGASPSGERVAIKILWLMDMFREQPREARDQHRAQARAPAVMKLHSVLKGSCRLYLIQEYITGGDL
jgi:hypothetical protein